MFGRLSRWYMAALTVGLIYVGAWVWMGFRGAVIQVEWGAFPELEGAEVVIDGAAAGTLFRRGRQTLSGFRVPLGEHRVWIPHPERAADTAVVSVELRGAQYLLYAFPHSVRTDDGYERRVGLDVRIPD